MYQFIRFRWQFMVSVECFVLFIIVKLYHFVTDVGRDFSPTPLYGFGKSYLKTHRNNRRETESFQNVICTKWKYVSLFFVL